MRARSRLSLLLAALLAAGCALESPPRPDEIRAQSMRNFSLPPAYAAGGVQGTVADDWVAQFADAQLDALVREALAYNTDLQVAAARVEQAAAYAKASGSAIYPAVNLLGHGSLGKSGGDGSGVNLIGLFANWELDIWGRARSERAAGTTAYEAVALDAEYARQSIAALVAKSWLLAIEARLQRAVADDIVHSSEEFLGLSNDRLRVGIGDQYDVFLAQANVETARDAARQLAFAQEQALRALETVVGRYPAAAVDVAVALPRMPPPVPVGLPSELLERRPDVIAAERRVAAAFYSVSEAKASRLPKLALTANVMAMSTDVFVLQNHANPLAGIGANLVLPLFAGYALEAKVEARTAEQHLAVAEYGRVGAKAFGEVESALSAGFAADARETILARSVASNARTVELAQVRYRVGSGDLRAVLQQNVALYGARTALLHAQTERLVQRVNLHLALGGSFEPREPNAAAGAADFTAVAKTADGDR